MHTLLALLFLLMVVIGAREGSHIRQHWDDRTRIAVALLIILAIACVVLLIFLSRMND